jgi:outer membrane protein OmpA-like peptidoglycan-associated protein
VKGHTVAPESGEYYQKPSQSRANTVRDYLTGQGVRGPAASAVGFGQQESLDAPAEGRQSRRVELAVSGEPIGAGTQ